MCHYLCSRRILLYLALVFAFGCAANAKDVDVTAAENCSDGQLTLHDDFEGGNMGRCEVLGDAAFRLYLSPENDPINNSPWYAFAVTGGSGQEVRIELQYELHSHRYTPKLSNDRLTWRTLDETRQSISQDGTRVTLTVAVRERPLLIAGQELFVQSDYESWMSGLVDEYGARLSTIGNSAGGRPIYLLESDADDTTDKATIVLLGRAHPPEVTGALAMRHFVDHLFARHSSFLETHKLFMVPLLNPDGVALGYWRHGLGGLDLNRDWGPFSQPETTMVVEEVNRRLQHGMQPRLMLDFHSTHRNVFYTQTDEEDAKMGKFTQRWFDQARQLGVYPFEHAQRHNQGRPTSKNYFHSRFQIPAITYELADTAARDDIKSSAQRFADAMVSVLEEMKDEG